MHAVMYRWRLEPGSEDDFVRAWSEATALIREQCGSYGSRLHAAADGTWVAYARWPHAAAREACNARIEQSVRAMSKAIAESFPPLILDIVEDQLVEPAAEY